MQWLVCTYNNSIDLCHIFKVSKHLQKTTSNRICKFYQGFVSIVYMYVRSDVIKEDQRTFTKNFLRKKKKWDELNKLFPRHEANIFYTSSAVWFQSIRGVKQRDCSRRMEKHRREKNLVPRRCSAGWRNTIDASCLRVVRALLSPACFENENSHCDRVLTET